MLKLYNYSFTGDKEKNKKLHFLKMEAEKKSTPQEPVRFY